MQGAKLIPNKNHKTFVSELCNLLKDYSKLKDLRDKDEVTLLLIERVPKILNNFDKSDPSYGGVEMLLTDIIKNLGIVIKFVKEG